MANTLRIKRSVSTNTPSALAQGELANAETGTPNGINELFIGEAGPGVFKLTRNLNGSPAEPTAGLAAATPVTADYLVFEDVTDSQGKRVLFSATPLSIFNDDLGHVENVSTSLTEGTRTGTLYDINSDGASPDIQIPVFNSTESGMAGASGGGTDNYLRADGNWAAPPGGSASNSFETHTVTDTDSGYTWAETGSAVASIATDTLTWVSGTDIDIDVDATSQAIKVIFSNATGYTTNAGTVTGVNEGTLTDISGTAAEPVVDVDLSEASEAVYAPGTDYLLFLDGGASGTAAKESGTDFAALLAGTGLDSASGVMTLDIAELGVTSIAAADWIAFDDAGTSSKALVSGIDLALFNNSAGWDANDADTVLTTDTGSATWTWIIDDDTMGTASATTLATSESVKQYVDDEVLGALASEMTYKGGYNAATDTPQLDTGTPTLAVGDMYIVTVAGTFFALPVVAGDTLIANTASTDAASFADWDIVEGMQTVPDAAEDTKGIIEIATQAEVDAEASALLAVTPAYLHETVFDGGTF